MIKAVTDSSLFIHLAILNHVHLLHRYVHPILTIRQVYEEVVTQGGDRPGAQELASAYENGLVRIEEVSDRSLIDRLRQSSPSDVSEVDLTVLALAIEQQAALLSDDVLLRVLATAQGVSVIGSIGILIQARLEGVITELKPLLDRLIAGRFYLDPQGRVYRDALGKVGEE